VLEGKTVEDMNEVKSDHRK